MNISNGMVCLNSEIKAWAPRGDFVEYTDGDRQRVQIPVKLLIHLYEGFKWELEQVQGRNWQAYESILMNTEGSHGK
jgi:hypothetical protein